MSAAQLDLTAPIRSLRLASGLTYAQAAARLAPPGHPHPSTGLVTRPESYGAGARVCTVVRFARAWGCPVEVRVGGRVLAWPEEGLDVSVRDLVTLGGMCGAAVEVVVVASLTARNA